MKKSYALIFSLSLSIFVSAQAPEKCATMQNYRSNTESNSDYAQQIWSAETQAREWLKSHRSETAKTNSTVVIPVVFHNIYKNTTDPTYLHDSVFYRQLEILNETYGLTNSNFANTRAIFDTLAANTDIQFCMASVDPNGNPTTGINRVQSSTNFFMAPFNDNVKDPTQGGVAPWDANYYLNIWTCDMSFNGTVFVLGYAAFPGGPASKDGVVLQYQYVGYQNTGNNNNLGRTAVHEVGHWLGMRHIWGDGQQGSNPCDSTDYVDDTPRANDASQQTCNLTKNTCSNEDTTWTQANVDPPDMVENYMDYSNDACMTMFTKGQKLRMWSFINTLRTGLLNNTVACILGTNEQENLSRSTYVFPNPTKGLVNINFGAGSTDNLQVEITDALGRQITAFKPNSLSNVVDLTAQPAGIYFAKIKSDNLYIVKKIILQ